MEFGKDTEGMGVSAFRTLTAPVKETLLTPTYTIELADSEDLSTFYPYKTAKTLDVM